MLSKNKFDKKTEGNQRNKSLKNESPVNVLAVSVAGLEVSLVDEMEVEVIDEP